MPTAIRMLKGNPGHRTPSKLEPQPESFTAEPPEFLVTEGLKEWTRISAILKQMRVLTQADYMLLGNICLAYQTMVQAQRDLAKAGLLYKTQSGYIQQSPLMGIVTRHMDIVNKGLAQFGMTPSSRVRLQMETAAPPKTNTFLSLRRG